ncbi:hypothetical protein ABIE44_002124 [Marmoricola sp. OAE513]
MFNQDLYRAETNYRREVLRRDWRPLRGRRAARSETRNQIDTQDRPGLAS